MDSFTGDAFEALGEWQFNHDKQTSFVGVLNFSPNGGLELRVVDPTREHDLRAMFGSQPASKGISASGRTHSHGHISLFDGFVSSTPMSSHGPAEMVYFFNRGLLGLATSSASEEKFTSIFATGELLRVWLDQKIIEVDPNLTGDSVNIRHTRPKSIETQVDGDRMLTLAWDRLGPTLSVAQSSIEISSRPWIGLEFTQPQSVNRALNEIDAATRFISLLSGFELRSSLVQLRLPKEDIRDRAPIYFLGSRMQIKERLREPMPLDLLFTFPAIQSRFKDLSTRWFEFQKAVPGCMNVFFSAHYSSYTNQRLFALTTALEALHRHITHVKNSSLRNRVKESIDRISILAPDIIGDRDGFARRIVACRNNEAHCNDEDDGGSGSEHFRLASKLRVIIDAVIMMELGLTISEVSLAMRRSREYWFYASNETWAWNAKE